MHSYAAAVSAYSTVPSGSSAWIGLYDEITEGTYVWTDGVTYYLRQNKKLILRKMILRVIYFVVKILHFVMLLHFIQNQILLVVIILRL